MPGVGHFITRSPVIIFHLHAAIQADGSKSPAGSLGYQAAENINHLVLRSHGWVPTLVYARHEHRGRSGRLTILRGTHPGFGETGSIVEFSVHAVHRPNHRQHSGILKLCNVAIAKA